MSHPLAPAQLFMPQYGLYELISGQPFVSISGIPNITLQQPSVYGPAVGLTDSIAPGFTVGTGPFLGGLPQWTIAASMYSVLNNKYGTLYCERASAGNDILKLQQIQSSANGCCAVYRNDAGSLVNPLSDSSGRSTVDGAVHLLAATYDGTTVNSYVDGVLSTSTTWPGGNNNFTDSGIQRIIGYDLMDTGVLGSRYDGGIIAIYLFKRALRLPELIDLMCSPFGMLRAVAKPVLGMAAAAPPSGQGAYAMILA